MSQSILRSYAEEQALLDTGKYERADDGGVVIKDGYFASNSPMEGYGEADMARSTVRRNVGGAGQSARDFRDVPSTKFIYKKDEIPEAQAAPAEPEAEKTDDNLPVKLSERAAKANAYTKAFEDVMLPRQGDYTIKNDQSVAQDFKDQYQLNLTEELKAKDPATLATKKAEIELEDKSKAKLGDYSLGLSSEEQANMPGNALIFS